jgi:membrane associated rhomboid family serine protease
MVLFCILLREYEVSMLGKLVDKLSKNRSDRLPPPLVYLVIIMAFFEFSSSIGDLSVSWVPPIRGFLFAYGAFWNGLLSDELIPNFGLQPYSMFITHVFLHGGFIHFVMNAVVLLSLGKIIYLKTNHWSVVFLFIFSGVLGGLSFFLLSKNQGPMIGASGSVFGFLGLWQFWDFKRRLHAGYSLKPVFSTILGLVIVNVILAFMLGGGLAWEAHLGGFVAGVIFGVFGSRSV